MSAPRDFLFMGEQPEQFGRERIYDGTDALRAEVETLRAQKLELLAALVALLEQSEDTMRPHDNGVANRARAAIKNCGGQS